MYLIDMILNIVMSMTTGFLGSLFVILFLYRLRPSIEFSQDISEGVLDGKPCYGFKMINKSSYPIIDVYITLELVTPISVPDGHIYSSQNLPLINGRFFMIEKFNLKDINADYAFRVRTAQDIRSIWIGEGQYLRLSIVGKHSLSGFYGVFQKIYYTKGNIKNGSHRFGTGMDVQPTL